jgi:catechol 2,3-dioxygenase-like lactoylglutathione lyase family enzyme
MTTTQTNTATATQTSDVVAIPMKLEVATLPVADVDRAKAFYQRLGWRLDIDFEPAPGVRGVQLTPPGSPTSIQFGENTNSMKPGSLEGLFLVVDDIEAARDDLIERGVDVGEIWHLEVGKGPVPGLDPERRSYASRATFADPDGNRWVLQEITERLPGRV